MLAYFPQIYPGELLYSVLARYHRHMGTPSPIQSMEALFGRRLIVASVDLPGYLQVLADRLPPNFGWTADRIIDELTLLPRVSEILCERHTMMLPRSMYATQEEDAGGHAGH